MPQKQQKRQPQSPIATAPQAAPPQDEDLRRDVEAEAIRIVQNEKTQWEYSYCYVTPTVAFVMREVIRQCRKNYWGVFDEPVDSKTGREKVWQHVSKAFVDFFIKNVDLDTKDISFVAKHPDAVALTAVIRSRIHAALDEMGFGALLDMTERQIAIDGTAVWETAEVNGKPKVRYVDILNCYIDPAVESIAEAELFTERFVPSVWEFKRMAKKGGWINWEKVTGSTMVNRWDGQLNVAAQTSSSTNIPLVEVYRTRGLISLFIFTGNREDRETFVPGEVICSYSNGAWQYHYAERRKDNADKGYVEFWATRVHGRWYGEGYCERLIQYQLASNIISNTRLNRAYVTQLGLFQIRDGSGITPQMVAKLAANGSVKVKTIGEDIAPLDMPTGLDDSVKLEEYLYSWAQRVTGAYDSSTGDPLPASTPATNAAIQSQAAKSQFSFIRDGIGEALQLWVTRDLAPIVFSKIKVGDIVRVTGDPDAVKSVRELYVNKQVADIVDQFNKDGVFVDPDQVAREHQRLLAKRAAMGKDEFIKLDEVPDVFSYDCQVLVTNEEMDKGVMLSNLVTMLPAAPQYAQEIIQQVFDLMGFTFTPPQQVAPPQNQPQAQGMQPQQQPPPQGAPQAAPTQNPQALLTAANTMQR